MRNFITETKVGHFLFIVTFSLIVCGILSMLTSLELGPMMLGSFPIAALFAIFDDNDRWI